MATRFHHEQLYRGADYAKRMNQTRLVVCGAGAIGSNLVDALTRQGYGNLSVIDKDRIEIHNVNTQAFGDQEVGGLKAVCLKTKVFRQTGIEINAIAKELITSNVKQMLGKADLVVDAFDNTASRQLVQTFCRNNKIACLHAGLFADYGEVIWDERYRVPQDAAAGADVCDYPLARNLITVVVSIVAEEIVDFCLAEKPRRLDWSFTLKDLTIRQLKL